MKQRKLRKNLLPFFLEVMAEKNIHCEIHELDDEFALVESELNGKTFHRYVEEAMCHKESGECNGRLVISYQQWVEGSYDKGRCFHILKKDLPRFRETLGIAA